MLPQAIRSLKKEAPLVRLEIYEETTSVLLSHLKEGKIDLGILALPVDASGAVTKPVAREDFWLAVGKSHPLAARKKASVAAIKSEKLLILQEGHCFAEQALEYCRRSRDDDQVIFQGSSLLSVLKLAAGGDGITFVPRMAVEPRVYPELVFLPFQDPKPYREIGFIWRVSAPLTRACRAVMDAADRAIRDRLSVIPA